MSLWLFWLLVSDVPSHRLLFFCLSLKRPDKDDRLLFFCLFAFFTLSLTRSAEDLFWLLTECRFVERLFQRVRTGERGLFRPRLRGDKAQQTFCLKVRSFSWTLQKRSNHPNMLSHYDLFCFYNGADYVQFITLSTIRWNRI